MTLRVFVIGAGRAGRALTHAMRVGGVDVVGLHGRQPEEGITCGDWPASLESANVVLITVRDSEIDGVMRELLAAKLAAGTVVVHASGNAEPPALDLLRTHGHPGGTFHPLLPLTDPTRATEQLHRAWIGIDGDEAARSVSRELAAAIGARVLEIPRGREGALPRGGGVRVELPDGVARDGDETAHEYGSAGGCGARRIGDAARGGGGECERDGSRQGDDRPGGSWRCGDGAGASRGVERRAGDTRVVSGVVAGRGEGGGDGRDGCGAVGGAAAPPLAFLVGFDCSESGALR